jgi:predicted SAM-dependent methyltransferase
LNAFATPRTPLEVNTELAELPQTFRFLSIHALLQSGALVTVDEYCRDVIVESGRDGESDQTASLPGEKATEEQFRRMALLVRELASDMQAFGSYISDTQDATGWHPGQQLEDINRELTSIAAELSERRAEYLELQLRKLGLLQPSDNLKLNLGSGSSQLEGWVNIDLSPAELALRVSWGLPFGDNSVSYIYMSHVLEHLYYEDEALAVLRDIFRLLTPGGVVRFVVPDIERCIRAYVENDLEFFETRKKYWPQVAGFETRLEHFLEYAGAGIRPNNFWGHKYGYDLETLQSLLQKAGFTNISRSEYMSSRFPPLRIDSVSKTAGFKFRDTYYSLFVEAVK